MIVAMDPPPLEEPTIKINPLPKLVAKWGGGGASTVGFIFKFFFITG
jgi:hypothetical protein